MLHHEQVVPAEPPHSWLLFTHGIYGSGANWRSIARKVIERRPGWGAVLVDLPGHGRSPAGEPPHTVDACAAALAEVVRSRPVRGAVGHSFGGKVVLALRTHVALDEAWVLDATPSARPAAFDAPDNTVRRVLEVMERLPPTFARRDDFVAAVTADGHADTLARWLAMNLEPIPLGAAEPGAATPGGAFRLKLDLPMIRALLADYFARDLWDAVEGAHPGTLHVVIAERSTTISPDDRARLDASPAQVHRVDAGHWLHLDAPERVIELLSHGT